MKYKFSYDPVSKIVRVEFFHYVEDDDVEDFVEGLRNALGGKEAIGAILDHGPLLDKGIPNLSRKGRKAFGEVGKRSGIKKFAMVSVPAMVKTVSQTIGMLTKDTAAETRFFKTETEALRWLKGE